MNLLPRDTVFFDLFEQLSDHCVSTANHLRALAYEFPASMDAHAQRIRQEEHDADKLSHEALDRLDPMNKYLETALILIIIELKIPYSLL